MGEGREERERKGNRVEGKREECVGYICTKYTYYDEIITTYRTPKAVHIVVVPSLWQPNMYIRTYIRIQFSA